MRRFGNPEEIERQMRQKEEKQESSESEQDSSSEEEEVEARKRSPIEGLIEIQNPNRAPLRSKKAGEVDLDAPVELSRREREEVEKQEAKQRYEKLHREGKTEQARNDLARLAIVKKQREDAARKREEAKKEVESKARVTPLS